MERDDFKIEGGVRNAKAKIRAWTIEGNQQQGG